MPNPWFQFKQFTVWHNRCAMKVGTDGVLLGAWVNAENSDNILDIGTGTGLIALMLAQKSSAQIVSVEIDDDAVEQARENLSTSKWSDRMRVYHCSFQDFISFSDLKYDLIITNPPFFENSLKPPDKKRNFARHSDTLPASELLSGVNHFLSDKGNFYIILPYVQAQVFIVDAALCHLYCVSKLNCKPASNKKVNRVLMQFSRKRSKIKETEIVIRDNNNEYTKQYRELTKDYYLGF